MAVIGKYSVLNVTTAGATDLLPNQVLGLVSIRWVGATTAGHTITVTDAAGELLWKSVAAGANYVEESNLSSKLPKGIRGLKVTVMTSGTAQIYYTNENK